MRWIAACLIGGLLACNAAQAQPAPEHPAIESAALEMLKASSQKLASAKALSFTAMTGYEAPARDGQPLFYTTLSQVALRRPDKLRVETPGDGPPSTLYYDGKTLMVYDPATNLTAVANAPPTIDAAMTEAYDKAAIFFPFMELLVADPYKNISEGITTAYVVGQSHVVGNTITDIVVFANANVQAEIWIGIDDGLPRLIRAVYPKDPLHARHEVVFSNWHLNQPMKDTDFQSDIALKAPRMPFARPDSAPSAKP